MDRTLPLHPLHSLLPLDQPFTPAMARAVGISSRHCRGCSRPGWCGGCCVGCTSPRPLQPPSALRAAAVGLLLGPRDVAVDRLAAWVARRARSRPGASRRARSWVPGLAVVACSGGTCVTLGGVRVTSPLRTALDLGRLLPPGPALRCPGCLGAARSARWSCSPSCLGSPASGGRQLRTLAAQVDARSAGPAESLLRLHWNAANLPTPVPGRLVAAGLAWSGCPWRSNSASSAPYSPTRSRPPTSSPSKARAGGSSYSPRQRVLTTDPSIWTRHLEREFHQQLLRQVRDDEEVG